jgi:hypothetical protein
MFNVVDQSDEDNRELLLNVAMEFMQNHLSEGAWELLQLQLNPPLFITSKLSKPNIKIPAGLILQFSGLDITPENLDVISFLRKEIYQAIESARIHFKDFSLA